MIADFTREQRESILAGNRVIAARRLYELMQETPGLQRAPSAEECEVIVDLLVKSVSRMGRGRTIG